MITRIKQKCRDFMIAAAECRVAHILPINPHKYQIHQSYIWLNKCKLLMTSVIPSLKWVLWMWPFITPAILASSLLRGSTTSLTCLPPPFFGEKTAVGGMVYVLLARPRVCLCSLWRWCGNSSLFLRKQEQVSKHIKLYLGRSEDDPNGRTQVNCTYTWDTKMDVTVGVDPFLILLVLFLLKICNVCNG